MNLRRFWLRCRWIYFGVLLIARLTDLYRVRLRRAAWDPRDPRVACGPLRKQAAMLSGALSGRY